MHKDNVYTGDEARAKLMVGVNVVADAVKGTLGAGGYNALLQDPRPPYSIATNDGVSVARSIYLADPVENIGANLMKEIGQKSDKDGGDGTTTSITLAQAILQGGLSATASPMEVKRSLEECLPIIIKSIDAQTKEITVDDVGRVATISSENEDMGRLIQEVYTKIGKDGILYTDISKTAEDYYTLGKGVKVEDAALASAYMADTDNAGNFVKTSAIKNPQILLTKQRISSAMEINTIVTELYNKGIKELVIFCDEIEATVIPDLVMTRAKSGFRTVVIRMPVLWKDHWFEDLALLTGATVVDPVQGVGFKELKSFHLGTCDSILADKTDTYLEGTRDIAEYIAKLDAGDDEDKLRAARLNTKSARLFVGAPTESALSYKRLKLEDARNAAYQALHGGVVAGGGVALRNAAKEMPDTIGGNILREALVAPMHQIMTNAIGEKVGKTIVDEPNVGFDAKTMDMVDMHEAGIIDPAKIVKNAITNAISVASVVLSTKVIVTLPQNEEGKTISAQQQLI